MTRPMVLGSGGAQKEQGQAHKQDHQKVKKHIRLNNDMSCFGTHLHGIRAPWRGISKRYEGVVMCVCVCV